MRKRTTGNHETVTLGIVENGIAQRRDDGSVVIVRPARNGGPPVEVEVEREIADRWNLATGDVVAGTTERMDSEAATLSSEQWEDAALADEERDEPAAVRGESIPQWLVARVVPTERLTAVALINGLSLDLAEDRPAPRAKRHALERAAPDRLVRLATGPHDYTGRMLDFAAPFGLGYAGIISGQHGSGLTHTLQSVLRGVAADAPDCMLFCLLLRARGEEITDWRRRLPEADIVVCPTPQTGVMPEETLRTADLTLAAAQRQTEIGRHVVLGIDSLTALWGAMLEGEEAEAQRDADRSLSRLRIREWMQAAGSFAGEGLLGSGLGGSLTIVGTAWSAAIDTEAEEEGEIHPHLRLIEHVLHETSWRIRLSIGLARDRLFPAIDPLQCASVGEERLLGPELWENVQSARMSLAKLAPLDRYIALMNAVDRTTDLARLASDLV